MLIRHFTDKYDPRFDQRLLLSPESRGLSAEERHRIYEKIAVSHAHGALAFALARLRRSALVLDNSLFELLEEFTPIERAHLNAAVEQLLAEGKAIIVPRRGQVAIALHPEAKPRIIYDKVYVHPVHGERDRIVELHMGDAAYVCICEFLERGHQKFVLLQAMANLGSLPLTRSTFRFWELWYHEPSDELREMISELLAEGNAQIEDRGGVPCAVISPHLAAIINLGGDVTYSSHLPAHGLDVKAVGGRSLLTIGKKGTETTI